MNAWILDPSRTAEELINLIGVAKGALDASSMRGQAEQAFNAATEESEARERAKFGGG